MKKTTYRLFTGLVLCSSLFVNGCSKDAPNTNTDTNSSVNTEVSSEENKSAASGGSHIVKEDFKPLPPIDWDNATDLTREQLEAASTTFYLPEGFSGQSMGFNLFGEILDSSSKEVTPIRDILSEQTRFYSVKYNKYTKEEGGKEYALDPDYNVRTYSRLYDANGKLLRDWAETNYYSCINDWIFEYNFPDPDNKYKDDTPGRLINPYTSDLIDYVSTTEKVGNQYAFISQSGDYAYTITDRNGNIIQEVKKGEQNISEASYIRTMGDYIEIINPANEDNPEDSVENINNITIYKPDGSLVGRITNTDSIIFSNETDITYYDMNGRLYDLENARGGELQPITPENLHIIDYYSDFYICKNFENSSDYEYLYDTHTNKQIAGPYLFIELPESKSKYFYGATENGIDVFDISGKIIYSLAQKNISSITVYSNFIDYEYNDYSEEGYADLTLKPLDIGKYTSLYPKDEYYVGSYYLDEENHDRERFDILDSNFKPVISGLSYAGYSTKWGTLVSKGQQVGLMDYNGKWIMKFNISDFHNGD